MKFIVGRTYRHKITQARVKCIAISSAGQPVVERDIEGDDWTCFNLTPQGQECYIDDWKGQECYIDDLKTSLIASRATVQKLQQTVGLLTEDNKNLMRRKSDDDEVIKALRLIRTSLENQIKNLQERNDNQCVTIRCYSDQIDMMHKENDTLRHMLTKAEERVNLLLSPEHEAGKCLKQEFIHYTADEDS